MLDVIPGNFPCGVWASIDQSLKSPSPSMSYSSCPWQIDFSGGLGDSEEDIMEISEWNEYIRDQNSYCKNV